MTAFPIGTSNKQAEINENTSCSCWRDECGEFCPCMNIDCADDDCGSPRGCFAGVCACVAGGECD
jgi:hypothetical protein